MPEHIVILCTCGSESEAERIAATLVQQRLAACVNIASPVRSVYRWEGKVESATEWLLLIKTSAARFDEIARTIQALHSYQVPEIVALPIAAGSLPYLNWIAESVHE